MFSFFSRFKYFDTPLLAATLLLASAGLAILYATTLSDGSVTLFYRQLIFLGFGLTAFLFFSVFNYHSLAKANRVIYPIFIALLVYLPVFGSIIRSSRR